MTPEMERARQAHHAYVVRTAMRRVIVDLRAQGVRHPALDAMDGMCVEITHELDAAAPELPLGRPFVARPVAVGISKRIVP